MFDKLAFKNKILKNSKKFLAKTVSFGRRIVEDYPHCHCIVLQRISLEYNSPKSVRHFLEFLRNIFLLLE